MNHEGDALAGLPSGGLNGVIAAVNDVVYEASVAAPFMSMGYDALANIVIAELGLDPFTQFDAPLVEEGWWPLTDGTVAPAVNIVLHTDPLVYEAYVNPVTGEIYSTRCATIMEDDWSPVHSVIEYPMSDLFDFHLPKVSYEFDDFNVFGGGEFFDDDPATTAAGDSMINTGVQDASFFVFTQQPYLTNAEKSGVNKVHYSQAFVDKLKAAGVEHVEYYKWAPLENPGASMPTMWSKDGTNFGGGTVDGKAGNGWHGAPRQRAEVPHRILAHPTASPYGWIDDVAVGKTIADIPAAFSDDFTQYAGWTTAGNNANVYRGRTSARYSLSGDYTRATDAQRQAAYDKGELPTLVFDVNDPTSYTSLDFEYPIGRPVFTDRVFKISDDVARIAPRATLADGSAEDFFPLKAGSKVFPLSGDDPMSDYSGERAYHSVMMQQAAIVNGFYVSNYWHDLFYLKGFDEAAGNFQNVNYTGQGVGGDAVRVRLQYGAGNRTTTVVNNASYTSLERDGSVPTIQGEVSNRGGLRPLFTDLNSTGDEQGWSLLMTFHSPDMPFRDVGFEAETIAHELAHGLNQRLAKALPAEEGYCDLSGLMAFNINPYNNEDGPYSRGQYGYFMLPANRRPFNFADWKQYSTYAQYDTKYDGRPEDKLVNLRYLTDSYYFGLRRAPYSSSKRHNPFTLKDASDFTAVDYDIAGEYFRDHYDPDDLRGEQGMFLPSSPNYLQIRMANQTHNAGTLFANIIWQVRSQIIKAVAAEYGEDVFLETQDMSDAQKPQRPIGRVKGNDIMLGFMVDALKMIPDNSNFNDNREGFLSADYFLYDSKYEEPMWAGFAYRGMGHGSLMAAGGSGTGTGTRIALTESYKMPHLYVRNNHLSDLYNDVTIDDSVLGNGNGAIDPGEIVYVTVPVTNPWRNSSKTALGVVPTLTMDHPYIAVKNGGLPTNGNYVNIAPGATRNFIFVVQASQDASNFIAGEALNFNLNITTANKLYGDDNTIYTDNSDYATG